MRRPNAKRREKNTTSSGTSGHVACALYHDDAPRDFGPRIAYTSWRWFQVAFGYLSPGPKQGSEGGKSRPLDHMRQIPFLGSSVPPYYFDYYFDRYIFENVVIVPSIWYILRFEHANMPKNDRMTEGAIQCPV